MKDVRLMVSCECPRCLGVSWVSNPAFDLAAATAAAEEITCPQCDGEGRVRVEITVSEFASLVEEART